MCGSLSEKATAGSTSGSEGGFLLEWNCASREDTGDKIKLDFTFRTEPVRNTMRNEVLVSKVK